MAQQTRETAVTQIVEAGDIRFGYCRFGKAGGTPLLFLQYLNANLNGRDPALFPGVSAPGAGRHARARPCGGRYQHANRS